MRTANACVDNAPAKTVGADKTTTVSVWLTKHRNRLARGLRVAGAHSEGRAATHGGDMYFWTVREIRNGWFSCHRAFALRTPTRSAQIVRVQMAIKHLRTIIIAAHTHTRAHTMHDGGDYSIAPHTHTRTHTSTHSNISLHCYQEQRAHIAYAGAYRICEECAQPRARTETNPKRSLYMGRLIIMHINKTSKRAHTHAHTLAHTECSRAR